MQPQLVLYGDKDFAEKVMQDIFYKPSFGSLIKHVTGKWDIKSEEVDFARGTYRHIINLRYLINKQDAYRIDQQIEKIAKFLEEKLPTQKKVPESNNTRDYQVARIIHDYIVKNLQPYTKENARESKLFTDSKAEQGKKYEVHTLAAGLFAEEGVCQSYAMLFDRLATRMGLESRVVRGHKVSNKVLNKPREINRAKKLFSSYQTIADKGGAWEEANHMWNQVKIDGKWYHVDMTVDQSVSMQLRGYYYNKFLVSDDEMNKITQFPISVDPKTDQVVMWYQTQTIWNHDEAFKVEANYDDFGKLIYKLGDNKRLEYDMNKDLKFSTVKSTSVIGKDKVDFVPYVPSSEVKDVKQITMPHSNNSVIQVPTGTTAEKLPNYLGAIAITSKNSEELFELGSYKLDKVVVVNSEEVNKVANNRNSHITITLAVKGDQTFETLPVSIVFSDPEDMPKPSTTITLKENKVVVDQYHFEFNDLQKQENIDNQLKQEKDAEKKILDLVTLTSKDSKYDPKKATLSVEGLELIDFADPNVYKAYVVAIGEDKLKVKEEIKVEVKKVTKPSTLQHKIKKTEDTRDVTDLPLSTHENVKAEDKAPADAGTYLERVFGPEFVNIISKDSGLKTAETFKIELEDINGKIWVYRKDKDMFYSKDDMNIPLYQGEKMINIFKTPGTFNIRFVAQKGTEEPLVVPVKLTLTSTDAKFKNATVDEKAKAKNEINGLKSLSLTKRGFYSDSINRASYSNRITEIVETAKKDSNYGKTVTYTVNHVVDGKIVETYKKIAFIGEVVSERADYRLAKERRVVEPKAEITGSGQVLTVTYRSK